MSYKNMIPEFSIRDRVKDLKNVTKFIQPKKTITIAWRRENVKVLTANEHAVFTQKMTGWTLIDPEISGFEESNGLELYVSGFRITDPFMDSTIIETFRIIRTYSTDNDDNTYTLFEKTFTSFEDPNLPGISLPGKYVCPDGIFEVQDNQLSPSTALRSIKIDVPEETIEIMKKHKL